MKKSAIDFLFVLNAAITNIRLYPPASAIIQSSISRMHKVVEDALAETPTLELAESEKTLLVNGEPLPEKQQQKPQISSFLSLMLDLGIKSISFWQGIDRDEIYAFLQAVGKTPEQIEEAGGLCRIISANDISHIAIDEKVYVHMGPDQQIVSSEDTGDDSLVQKEDVWQTGTEKPRKTEPTSRSGKRKEDLARIMKGDISPLSDPETAAALPEAVSQLIDRKKEDTAAALMENAGKALFNRASEVRRAAAGVMADIDARLESGGYLEQRMTCSNKLVEWIRYETEISEQYRAVTERLENLSKTIIGEERRPGDAEHILEAYHLINRGTLTKDEAIQALAANMLQNVSTDHILDILLEEPGRKDSQESSDRDDIYTLVILGTTTVERLLDRLRDSQSMIERNRIVQAVSRIGKPAQEPVVERLSQEGPWYYKRNLALLLGRIGGQEHLDLLEPLLAYPDYRVQLETVKSIQFINGEKAGETLLENIDEIDPQLSGYVISVLGALRYEPAVPYLIELLESKRLWQSKPVRSEIRAKACEALGRIQASEAIAPLEKLIRAKGLFKGQPENVRSAALKALANIKRR